MARQAGLIRGNKEPAEVPVTEGAKGVVLACDGGSKASGLGEVFPCRNRA
jgi:hypothetical protein